jgi:hypothetical protein
MTAITCVGQDGQTRTFNVIEYSDGTSNGQIYYQVHAIPPPANGEFFSLTLTPLEKNIFRVTAIHGNDPVYRGMGIPEPLFKLVAALRGVTIVSSPGKASPGVWREPPATKMWERIRANGHATYDPHSDVYTFVP